MFSNLSDFSGRNDPFLFVHTLLIYLKEGYKRLFPPFDTQRLFKRYNITRKKVVYKYKKTLRQIILLFFYIKRRVLFAEISTGAMLQTEKRGVHYPDNSTAQESR
jgi:hypothetical protein